MRERLNDELSRRETADAPVFLSSAISWLNLTGIPQQDDELDRLLGRCHPASCDWLLDNPKIETWKGNDQAVKLAWVFGKPGAGQFALFLHQNLSYLTANLGKSVLCSSLIHHLQEQHSPVLYSVRGPEASNCRQRFPRVFSICSYILG